MKKIVLVLLFILSLVCQNTIAQVIPSYSSDEISLILSTNYPELYYYYTEGVLRVNSVIQSGDRYDIDYTFCRYYYTDRYEIANCLSAYFPALYSSYINGYVGITSLYKYVDMDTGKIQHHISYYRTSRWYDWGIYGRPYYRPYYRPAPPRPHFGGHHPSPGHHHPSTPPPSKPHTGSGYHPSTPPSGGSGHHPSGGSHPTGPRPNTGSSYSRPHTSSGSSYHGGASHPTRPSGGYSGGGHPSSSGGGHHGGPSHNRR